MRVEAEPSQPTSGSTGGTAPPSRPSGSNRRLLRWLLPLLAVVVVAVVAVVILTGGDEDDAAPRRAPAVAATVDRLAAVAGDVGHPVYWAGAQAGVTYELTKTRDGRVFVRYLPKGIKVGDTAPDYLTVGSYPQRAALATLTSAARRQGAVTVATAGGGRAFQDARRPTSAYLAFPGSDVQIEIFDRTPGRALRLARSGQIAVVGTPRPAGAAPRAATVAQLRALPRALGHPVYWAGEQPDVTYELTRTSDGRVYVRYLPPGVVVDADDPDYLTVGTYPLPEGDAGALATLRRAAADSGSQTFGVSGGGLAYVDERHPDSVYVAYPGTKLQIEVFDPSDTGARPLLASGRIAPLG